MRILSTEQSNIPTTYKWSSEIHWKNLVFNWDEEEISFFSWRRLIRISFKVKRNDRLYMYLSNLLEHYLRRRTPRRFHFLFIDHLCLTMNTSLMTSLFERRLFTFKERFNKKKTFPSMHHSFIGIYPNHFFSFMSNGIAGSLSTSSVCQIQWWVSKRWDRSYCRTFPRKSRPFRTDIWLRYE